MDYNNYAQGLIYSASSMACAKLSLTKHLFSEVELSVVICENY